MLHMNHTRSSYTLWIILIILLVVVYVWSALSTPKETVIIQTSVQSFRPELLNEKNPIVVEDRIFQLEQFLQIAFKWVSIKTSSSSGNGSTKVKSSYAVFWSDTSDTIITICRPNGSPVELVLPMQNVLILPMLWTWSVTNPCQVVTINTLFGTIMSLMP